MILNIEDTERQEKINAAGKDLHRGYQLGYGFTASAISTVLDAHDIDGLTTDEFETLHRWAVLGHA